jgi:hypothetical protein
MGGKAEKPMNSARPTTAAIAIEVTVVSASTASGASSASPASAPPPSPSVLGRVVESLREDSFLEY